MEKLDDWINILLVGIFGLLMYLLGRKNQIFEKVKHQFFTSKNLLIEVSHSKRLALYSTQSGAVYSDYEVKIKLTKTGNYRVILSTIKLVDNLERELDSVQIPDSSKVIDSTVPIVINHNISLKQSLLVSKISSCDFRVLITDVEGKTYLGLPK